MLPGGSDGEADRCSTTYMPDMLWLCLQDDSPRTLNFFHHSESRSLKVLGDVARWWSWRGGQ